MPPKLIVEVVGDTSNLERSFKRSGNAARGFQKDLGKATRGAAAGSGVFKGLGRSIAFASGGFLAFATAGDFLRKSIDAAREAQVTQKQLAAQFKASGKNVADFQKRIEKVTNRLSLLAGFENDELKAGFITIFRASGDASKSLRDLGLAADIARAKHIDLSKAATLVAKVEAGNTGLLRRQGVQIEKNATVEEALAVARRKFAGQAKAGTTAQERFGAVLHNTEEIIGTALLPTLNKFLTAGAKWLTQMNESGKLQKDVAIATKTLSDVIAGLKAVLTPIIEGFRVLGKVVGGTENEVKLLAAAFLILKLRVKAVAFTEAIAAIAGIGTASAGSAVAVGALRTQLLGLARLGALGVGIDVLAHADKKASGPGARGDFLQHIPLLGAIDSAARDLANKIVPPRPPAPTVARGNLFAPGGIVIHTHVNLDGREVARSTTKHQQTDKRRRPTQTRGRQLP